MKIFEQKLFSSIHVVPYIKLFVLICTKLHVLKKAEIIIFFLIKNPKQTYFRRDSLSQCHHYIRCMYFGVV